MSASTQTCPSSGRKIGFTIAATALLRDGICCIAGPEYENRPVPVPPSSPLVWWMLGYTRPLTALDSTCPSRNVSRVFTIDLMSTMAFASGLFISRRASAEKLALPPGVDGRTWPSAVYHLPSEPFLGLKILPTSVELLMLNCLPARANSCLDCCSITSLRSDTARSAAPISTRIPAISFSMMAGMIERSKSQISCSPCRSISRCCHAHRSWARSASGRAYFWTTSRGALAMFPIWASRVGRPPKIWAISPQISDSFSRPRYFLARASSE